MDYEPQASEGEDDESDGDGDDYPSDDPNAKLGELEQEAKDALSSPEDPPPDPAKPPLPTPTSTPRGCLYGISSSWHCSL
jgi:hypothetical protein